MPYKFILIISSVILSNFCLAQTTDSIMPFHKSDNIELKKGFINRNSYNTYDAHNAIYIEPGYLGRGSFGIGYEHFGNFGFVYSIPSFMMDAPISMFLFMGGSKNDYFGNIGNASTIKSNLVICDKESEGFGSFIEGGFRYYFNGEMDGSAVSASMQFVNNDFRYTVKNQYAVNGHRPNFITSTSITDYKLQYSYLYNFYERLFAEIRIGFGIRSSEIEYLKYDNVGINNVSFSQLNVIIESKEKVNSSLFAGLKIGIMF